VGDDGDEPTGMYGNEGATFSKGVLAGVDVTNPVSARNHSHLGNANQTNIKE